MTEEKTINVALAMLRQGKQLHFIFHGVSVLSVSNAIQKMSRFYGNCSVRVEKAGITNGKCYSSVVAIVTRPHTDILPEADWPMMITRFLQKSVRCNVTYFDSLSNFLNT